VLSLDNVSKSFGARKILADVTWSMPDDGRVGLVGLNGAGKSTLLRMIAGEMAPDGGRITVAQRARIAYLHQDAPEMGGRSLLAETLCALGSMQELDARRRELEKLLAHVGEGAEHDAALAELGDTLSELERQDFYSAESRAMGVLFGLGFRRDELGRDVGSFSGGIRMRIALAKILLERPDFILLDEPTNHLDIEARNWLEDYLDTYPGGIIVVSHDRYFLDRVTRRTIEIARARLTEYIGGYSAYVVERECRLQAKVEAYRKQREEIERMEAFISRFRYQASKAKLVQSRIRQLEKIDRLESPSGIEKPPAIVFAQCGRSGRLVFRLKGAVKRYGALSVYDGVELAIERGARVALVGPNGAGKSTMMKLLAGVEPLTAGERMVAANVAIGYFAQDLAQTLDYDRTVLDELGQSADGMSTAEIRGLLGAMLFSGDEVQKRVGVLSGGERARLALAKVLVRRNNCLLLDEPTNNLDIVAKDALLDALHRFPGTVVIVSHDRYLLNELVTEVIEVGRGQAVRYLGNYDDYLRKTAAMQSSATAATIAETRAPGAARPPGRAAPNGAAVTAAATKRAEDRETRRRRERLERKRRELEAAIEVREAERAALGAEMNDPNFYLSRADANELIARYDRLGREIDRLYAELVRHEAQSAPSTDQQN
jgi:ATP-binding cassette, subfamily F, member 3